MNMRLAYRQCHMEQPRGPAILHHTAWLPEGVTVLGASVRLREADGSWSDPWTLTFVGREPLPEGVVRKSGRAHLRQRKASDI